MFPCGCQSEDLPVSLPPNPFYITNQSCYRPRFLPLISPSGTVAACRPVLQVALPLHGLSSKRDAILESMAFLCSPEHSSARLERSPEHFSTRLECSCPIAVAVFFRSMSNSFYLGISVAKRISRATFLSPWISNVLFTVSVHYELVIPKIILMICNPDC